MQEKASETRREESARVIARIIDAIEGISERGYSVSRAFEIVRARFGGLWALSNEDLARELEDLARGGGQH